MELSTNVALVTAIIEMGNGLTNQGDSQMKCVQGILNKLGVRTIGKIFRWTDAIININDVCCLEVYE